MRRFPLFIVLFILLLAGCGGRADFRDVADLQLIQTLGYDRSGDIVTLSASTGAGPEALPTAVLRGSGRSIGEALDALRRCSESEDLFFAHVRFVVVGGEAARQGIGELLDWFERLPQTRLDVPLFVVEGGSAADLFGEGGEDGCEITSELLSLQRITERQGLTVLTTLGETAKALTSRGCAICCALRSSGSHLTQGTALLQGDALTDFAGESVTRGLALLTVSTGRGSLLLEDGQGGCAAVELTEREVGYCAEFLPDGTPELTVELRCRGALAEVNSALPADTLLPVLDASFAEAVASDAADALRFLCLSGADTLGTEARFRRADASRCGSVSFPEGVRVLLKVSAEVEWSFDLSAAENLHREGTE